jgi:hypothetical protein
MALGRLLSQSSSAMVPPLIPAAPPGMAYRYGQMFDHGFILPQAAHAVKLTGADMTPARFQPI